VTAAARSGWLGLGAAMLGACGSPSQVGAAPPEPPLAPLDSNYQARDFRDEVIYEALTDRFDDADPSNDSLDGISAIPGNLARYQGGDWQGLTRHLDYIRDLGATAIWISPIVQNVPRETEQDGYHGYWASDFTQLNGHFGDLADLQALVAAAHALGLRVFLDIAPNHAGPVFYYDFDGDGRVSPADLEPPFASAGPYPAPLIWTQHPALFLGAAPPNDALSAPSTALMRLPLSEQHFHRRGNLADFANQNEVELGDFPTGVRGLRDLATENPVVAQGLIDTNAEWIRLTDVDGLRLDAVPCIDRAFWVQFCSGLRERLAAFGKHDFFLFGEVFSGDSATVASYTSLPGSMDSAFDFSFKHDVVEGYVLQGGAAVGARAALETDRQFYATSSEPDGVGLDPWQGRVAFVDNHDTGRILSELDDPRAARVALTLLFTLDAIPSVYYGTEQGFSGGYGDASREPLWTAKFHENAPLFGYIRRLSAVRRATLALRRGTLVVRYASEHDGRSSAPDAGLLALEREYQGERVLVAVNAHAFQASTAEVSTGFAPGARLHDALGSDAAPEVKPGGLVMLRIGARESVVLVSD
jgi:alpha-amylase